FTGNSRVAGNAEAAAVAGGSGNLNDFALGAAKRGACINGTDDLVGFQCSGGIGQYAEQIRQKAIGFLGIAQALFGFVGGGIDGLDSKTAHNTFNKWFGGKIKPRPDRRRGSLLLFILLV